MNFRPKHSSLFFLLFIGPFFSLAQETNNLINIGKYVITPTRIETPVKKSGKVVYRITAEDIKKQPGKTVADLLNALPGINIDGAFGTPGAQLDYSIRGGRNGDILILIDGVPMSDPSSVANNYDLRLLNASMVEYLEVLKGGASTLYGSGAMAGIINIKLKKSTSGKPKVNVTQTIGSFKSSTTNAEVQGRDWKWGYLAAVGYSTSAGISSAIESDPLLEYDKDGFRKFSSRVHLTYDQNDTITRGLNISYDDFNSDYDDPFADANNGFRTKQFNLRYSWDLSTGGGAGFSIGYNRVARDYQSLTQRSTVGHLINYVSSKRTNISQRVIMTSGHEGSFNLFDDDGKTKMTVGLARYYSFNVEISNALQLNAGGRLSVYNSYKNFNFVYNINPVYTIDLGNTNSLKLFGSFSTAFIPPTVVQTRIFPFGNGLLKARKSASLEFGTSVYLGQGFTFNIEYFSRSETNAIELVPLLNEFGDVIGGIYENVEGERKIDGLEMDVNWNVTSDLSISGHMSYYNFADPTQFYRIPTTKYGMSGNYSIDGKTNFQLTYTYFGERQDAILTDPFVVVLEGYNMLDLSFSHEMKKDKLFVTAAVNNLLNEDFIGVYGFATRPINFNIGLNVKF